jgi:hypothetical protein
LLTRVLLRRVDTMSMMPPGGVKRIATAGLFIRRRGRYILESYNCDSA